jgi:hypothetical protein
MPFMPPVPTSGPLALRQTDDTKSTPPRANADADADADMATGSQQESPSQQNQGHHEDKNHRLAAKNRRKRYLEVHPEYFQDSSLELADPLLYDRLVRRFQTAAEREAEGRRKGFSGQMSTDVWRTEAKKDALRHTDSNSLFVYTRGPQGQIVEEDKDEIPMTKEEGLAWWKDEMTQRFLRGGDDDFDYKVVDKSKYDPIEEERDIQDAYFDEMDSDFDSDGEGKEKVLTGETGIQDY